jgi:hypothetical protein
MAPGRPLCHRRGCAIILSPGGHFRATKGVDPERELVYVVQTAAGQQALTPSQFAAEYGWKNDPDKVGR